MFYFFSFFSFFSHALCTLSLHSLAPPRRTPSPCPPGPPCCPLAARSSPPTHTTRHPCWLGPPARWSRACGRAGFAGRRCRQFPRTWPGKKSVGRVWGGRGARTLATHRELMWPAHMAANQRRGNGAPSRRNLHFFFVPPTAAAHTHVETSPPPPLSASLSPPHTQAPPVRRRLLLRLLLDQHGDPLPTPSTPDHGRLPLCRHRGQVASLLGGEENVCDPTPL